MVINIVDYNTQKWRIEHVCDMQIIKYMRVFEPPRTDLQPDVTCICQSFKLLKFFIAEVMQWVIISYLHVGDIPFSRKPNHVGDRHPYGRLMTGHAKRPRKGICTD